MLASTDINRDSALQSGSTRELFARVYDELRTIAKRMMRSERAEHTLSATALVNEAFLRLGGGESKIHWDSRGHFFCAAGEAMRRILIDHARAKVTRKRSASRQIVELDSLASTSDFNVEILLDVDSLLDRLEKEDPLAAEFLKLRLFAGRSVVEAGEILKLSKWSAYQLWDFCKARFAIYKADLSD